MDIWLLDSPGPAWLAILGWSLLHFLWQGALLGLLFAITLRLLARTSAQARYLTALSFLFLLGACPPLTFWILSASAGAESSGVTQAMQQLVVNATPASEESIAARALGLLGQVAPWTVIAWALGVVLTSSRLFTDWQRVRRLIAAGQPVDDGPLGRILDNVARSLELRRAVRLLESAAVEVPVVIGWLKPVVLVPSSVLLGLDPRQLELILLHELAHVRRGDYLVNLLQVAIETLLFYHPVVRFVSERVRQERENCCDDLVVTTSQDRLAYARALLELEGLRGLAASAALSSAGGNLPGRIRRIMGMPAPQRGAADWIAGIALTALGVASLGLGSVEEAALPDEPAAATADIEAEGPRAPVAEEVRPAGQAAFLGEVSDSETLPEPKALPGAPPDGDIRAGRGPDTLGEPAVGAPAIISAPARREDAGSSAPAQRSPRAEQPAAGTAARVEAPSIPLLEVAVGARPLLQPVPIETELPAEPPGADAAGAGPDIDRSQELGRAAARETGGELVRAEPPSYPASARHSGHEGYVVVSYTVTRSGRVQDVEVVEAGPRDLFSRAARKALRNWRYEPFRVDGVAVEKRLTRRFSFELDGPGSSASDDCVLLTGTRLCR